MSNKKAIIAIAITTLIAVNFQDTAFANSYSGIIIKNHTKIERLIQREKYEKAKELCLKALDKNPNDITARLKLGAIYSNQYKLESASKEFTRILKNNPNNAEAHNGLGLVYYRKTTSSNMDVRNNIYKFYQAAINEFTAAINSNPNYHKAYVNMANVLKETGQINNAEDYYKKALAIESKDSEAIEGLGTVLFAKQQLNAAIDKYQEAITLNSKNSSAYYHLGEALIKSGQYGEAINKLQTSLYLFPNSAPVHDMLGKAYEKQGNEAAAITEYNKAIMIKPEYSQSYLNIANIYHNRGDEEFAISELKSAISINDSFDEGKLQIAMMSLKVGKIDQSIKYFKELTESEEYKKVALKGISNAYFFKAQEVSNKGTIVSEYEYLNAEEALKQAIIYDPNDLELYLALLRVSRLTYKDSQSDFYLNKIISSSDYRPIAHIIKGEALLSSNKFQEARDEFKQALHQLDDPEDLMKVGEIFIVNRQYEFSRDAFNRVLGYDSENKKAKRALITIKRNEALAISKYNRALAFYKEGQKMAAIESFKDAISLDCNLVNAHYYLAKLYEKKKYYPNAIDEYSAYVNLARIKGKDLDSYQKKISKLQDKIDRMKQKNQTIKKYTNL